MLLTLAQIKALLAKLEGVRRDSGTQGTGAFCETPHTDSEGNDWRWEPKPRSRRPVGHVYPDGTTLEERSMPSPEGLLTVKEKGIRVPLGVHGRAYLAVDPASGEVRCAKCGEAK